jgi:hypothetical protein
MLGDGFWNLDEGHSDHCAKTSIFRQAESESQGIRSFSNSEKEKKNHVTFATHRSSHNY